MSFTKEIKALALNSNVESIEIQKRLALPEHGSPKLLLFDVLALDSGAGRVIEPDPGALLEGDGALVHRMPVALVALVL